METKAVRTTRKGSRKGRKIKKQSVVSEGKRINMIKKILTLRKENHRAQEIAEKKVEAGIEKGKDLAKTTTRVKECQTSISVVGRC